MNNYEKELEFIKNNIKKGGEADITPQSLMDSFDKTEIMKKLKELGMDSVANRLSAMSEGEIERIIKTNPQIIKKAKDILNDGR